MNNRNDITITVSGAPKSGKSIIVANILALLANAGIDCVVRDDMETSAPIVMQYGVGKLTNIRDTINVFLRTECELHED